MTNGSLDKDLIPQSNLWTMALGFTPGAIDVVLFPPVQSEPVIHRSVPLDGRAPSRLRAIEDAVYDNPLLLSDFRRIICAIDTPDMLILPPEAAADKGVREGAFALTHPDAAGLQLTVIPTAAPNASLVMGADPALTGFLQRTFFQAELIHPMCPLIGFTCASTARRHPVMLVRLQKGRADVVAADTDGKLLMANSFRIGQTIDAAYYVMAARTRLGLAPDTPLRLSGPVDARRSLAATLHPYLSDIADLALPPRLWQAGTPALSAPLHLILLHPSCA